MKSLFEKLTGSGSEKTEHEWVDYLAIERAEREQQERERRARMTESEKLREFTEKQEQRIAEARTRLDEAYAIRYRAITLTGEFPSQLSHDKLEARDVALNRLVEAVENLKYAEGRVRQNERLAEMAGEDEDVKRLFLRDATQVKVAAIKAYGERFEANSWAVWHA